MSKQIDKLARELEDQLSDVAKGLTLSVTANLVETTPVDTGFARANWVPNIGQPAAGPVGSPSRVDSSAQTSGLTTVASTYDITQGPVYVTNNVRYIERLNDGSSQQAPAGFVQLAIARAIAEVNRK